MIEFLSLLALIFGVFYGGGQLIERHTEISPKLRQVLLDPSATRRLATLVSQAHLLLRSAFGPRHLSSRCILLSFVVSLGSVLLIVAVWTFVRPCDASAFFSSQGNSLSTSIYVVLIFASVLNLIPDYFSLLETRVLLSRVSDDTPTSKLLAIAVIDVVLSSAIFFLGLTIAITVLRGWLFPAHDFELGEALAGYFQTCVFAESSARMGFTLAPFFYSTLATSVWLWLFVTSALMSRFVQQVSQWLGAYRPFVKNDQPVILLGFLASVIAVTFALALKAFSVMSEGPLSEGSRCLARVDYRWSVVVFGRAGAKDRVTEDVVSALREYLDVNVVVVDRARQELANNREMHSAVRSVVNRTGALAGVWTYEDSLGRTYIGVTPAWKPTQADEWNRTLPTSATVFRITDHRDFSEWVVSGTWSRIRRPPKPSARARKLLTEFVEVGIKRGDLSLIEASLITLGPTGLRHDGGIDSIEFPDDVRLSGSSGDEEKSELTFLRSFSRARKLAQSDSVDVKDVVDVFEEWSSEIQSDWPMINLVETVAEIAEPGVPKRSVFLRAAENMLADVWVPSWRILDQQLYDRKWDLKVDLGIQIALLSRNPHKRLRALGRRIRREPPYREHPMLQAKGMLRLAFAWLVSSPSVSASDPFLLCKSLDLSLHAWQASRGHAEDVARDAVHSVRFFRDSIIQESAFRPSVRRTCFKNVRRQLDKFRELEGFRAK